MEIVLNPGRKEWAKLLQRPYYDNASVLQAVQTILNEVKQKGDLALKQFSKDFDRVSLNEFKLSEGEIEAAESGLSSQLKAAIQQAKKKYRNISCSTSSKNRDDRNNARRTMLEKKCGH